LSSPKILINDEKSGESLIYTYKTELEVYEDGTSARFLVGELKMKNLNTFYFKDGNPDNWHSLRMSIGWRNPQQDAYDVHNFEARYDSTDPSKIEWTATDGYALGSIESKYYNWVFTSADSSVGDGFDYNSFYNRTIKQWTDIRDAAGNNYRIEETS